MDNKKKLAGLFLLAVASTCTGCASVSVDAQGRTQVRGLVWLTLPAPPGRGQAAEQLRARSFGISLTRGPLVEGLVLGYSDQSLAMVRNDSAVRLIVDIPEPEGGR